MANGRITSPIWLSPPQVARLACEVSAAIHPQERTVEIPLAGKHYTAIVPAESVVMTGDLPGNGTIRIVLVAELPGDDQFLAELPTPPINGSQRVKIAKASLVA